MVVQGTHTIVVYLVEVIVNSVRKVIGAFVTVRYKSFTTAYLPLRE